MTIGPYVLQAGCPKCGSDGPLTSDFLVKWHPEGSCPPAMAWINGENQIERIPPGLPEHLHITCSCGFSWLMEPADTPPGPKKCPKCGTGPEGHLCP